MILMALLVSIMRATYAQYPAESFPQYPSQFIPSYRGAGGAQTSYGTPNYHSLPGYQPGWLPEYPDSEEFLYPRRYHSASASSESGSNCDNCRRVILSCGNATGSGCFKPRVRYLKGNCKQAVVSCDSYGENAVLLTSAGDVLSDGLGSSKFITCKDGRWTTRDIYGDRIGFSGLRCYKRAPRYPTPYLLDKIV